VEPPDKVTIRILINVILKKSLISGTKEGVDFFGIL
jgi:hypothetical protein